MALKLACAFLQGGGTFITNSPITNSSAAEVGNLASLDNVFSLLIISLWDMCNNIQVGVEFSPLGN